MNEESLYLGRLQQGMELLLVVQCIDSAGASQDPTSNPVVSIYLDGATPTLIETVKLAADMRGVVVGFFRHPLFLGPLYDTAGRYLLVHRYVDGDGNARQICGAFHLLPGGYLDGAVIALHYIDRPNSRFLIYQTDGGNLVRGRNPR